MCKKINTKSIIATLLFCIFISNQAIAGLPKEAQRDIYMSTLTEALKAKDYKQALPYFKKIEDLKLPISKSFYYFKGETLSNTGDVLGAEKVLTLYINKAGNKGKHYKAAIKLMAKVMPKAEAKRKKLKKEKEAKAKKKKAGREAKEKERRLIAALKKKLPSVKLDVEMVDIPKGCFLMGTNKVVNYPDYGFGSKMSPKNEGPQHKVCLNSYRMAKYEVTNGLWVNVMGGDPLTGETIKATSEFNARFAVGNISWYEIQMFLKVLNAVTGKHYRLPSESEWEYAARAGTTTPHFWEEKKNGLFATGKENPGEYANCHQEDCKDKWNTFSHVGSFKPNPWGLYDTSGSVEEITQDCVNKDYKGAPTDGSAWKSGNCKQRIVRGGGFLSRLIYMRNTARGESYSGKMITLGIRLAEDI